MELKWPPSILPTFVYRQSHINVFLLLLELLPELVFAPDTSGLVPYHMMQNDARSYQEVLVQCVRLSLTADPSRHQYCWHHYVANFAFGVEAILDECQCQSETMVLELSEQLDAHGRRAVDVASLRNRQLIMQRIYYFGVFSIKLGCAEHTSATCKLHFAQMFDADGNSRNVALKFMKNRNQYELEILFRQEQQLQAEFVVGVICSYDSDADPAYRRETTRRGFSEYPYLVVMDAADRNFHNILKHERLMEDVMLARTYCWQILQALIHMRNKGLVHCDLKSNVKYTNHLFQI